MLTLYDKLFLGLDPGKFTGIAVYEPREKKFLQIETKNFWGAIERIEYWKRQTRELCVVIEDPAQNKPVFVNKKFVANARAFTRVASNVGANKKEGTLLIQYCQENNIPYIASKPGKYSGTKIKAADFKRITGWVGKGDQHARDAAMLCYGR